MSLERQSGRRACLGIDGGKRRGPADTSDTRGRDLTARPREEGISTSEKIVRI